MVFSMGRFVPVVPLTGWETSENVVTQNFAIASGMSNLENDIYSKLNVTSSRVPGDWEERLGTLVDSIEAQESDDSVIAVTDPEESFNRYLQNIVETQMLLKKLEASPPEKESVQNYELFCRVHVALQKAMVKLEDEFLERLLHHGQQDEAGRVSSSFSEEDSKDFSQSSFGESIVQGRLNNYDQVPEIPPISLMSPEVLPGIKDIVAAMFMSMYVMECCQAYISVRKDYLDARLSDLHIEKLSVEDIIEMDEKIFTLVVKRWKHALKMFVGVYLASEKCLCVSLFGDFSQSASKFCFFEVGKSSILQLLNFAQAVVIGNPSIEKLFRVLDIYEVLSHLLPDITSLFPEDSGCSVETECLEILTSLKVLVKKTFTLLEKLIRTKTSSTPFTGGGIHPLTKYVMNYIQVLSEYGETLNLILDGISLKDFGVTSQDVNDMRSRPTSTLIQSLLSVTSILESNLEGKSMLYQDDSLQHFFLMNNVRYMVKKAANSPGLSTLLGENWLRDHIRKYMQHARYYERASWSVVLSYLKYEGICSSRGSSPSTRVVKERFGQFNNAFEDIYRTQTAWFVADEGLREDLRISISLMVLPAYRTFHGRYAALLDGTRHRERYIKYSPDDLQRHLLDLFEGSQKSISKFNLVLK